MSSKTFNNATDNHYNNMNQSLMSSMPLDNQVNSLNHQYEQQAMRDEVYSLTNNGETCDNIKEVEYFKEEVINTFTKNEEASVTPNNSRKFSPEKIKGNCYILTLSNSVFLHRFVKHTE